MQLVDNFTLIRLNKKKRIFAMILGIILTFQIILLHFAHVSEGKNHTTSSFFT